jgi:DMSO reductase family type II enzyme chaperone
MTQKFPDAPVAADLYGFLARAFDYPDEVFWNRVEGGPLGDALGAGPAGLVPPEMATGVIPRRLQEEREAEYFATFEGGVPAYEGLCRSEEGRDGILEDLLRFYHYFGLKLSDDRRDFPDSFVTELEFVDYLIQLERMAAARDAEISSFQRAQRDFLDRHLTIWTERLCERFAERGIDNTYTRLARWLDVAAKTHLDTLERIVGEELSRPRSDDLSAAQIGSSQP